MAGRIKRITRGAVKAGKKGCEAVGGVVKAGPVTKKLQRRGRPPVFVAGTKVEKKTYRKR